MPSNLLWPLLQFPKHEQQIQSISEAYQIIMFILNETLKIPHKANLLCNYLFLTTQD